MIRHTARLFTIGATLARHDALFLAYRIPWAGRVAKLIARPKPGRPGQRLAGALQALGPSFVKLGQTLSTRADLVGADIAADLAMLQDRLPPFPTAQARATIEDELGQPIEAMFSSFDDPPIAAASIAQVHLAVTTGGEPVAVKVLRPGVEAAFERDIALFLWLAQWVERLAPWSRRLRPIDAVRVFAEWVRLEMDLRMEAAAAAELAENFQDEPRYRVPKVDWDRSGQRVMTLERVGGLPVDRPDILREAGHDPEAVLTLAAEALFMQVFRDGFFHADMHPGNAFVGSDGGLVVIDFGIMGRLDNATRDYLADTLHGLLTRDYARVAAVHFRLGLVPATHSPALFAQALRAIAEPLLDRPIAEVSIGRLLAQLLATTARFDMRAQPHLLLLQKTLLMAEGMGRSLCPGTNMWALARPLVEDWMRANRNPAARFVDQMAEGAEMLRRLPILMTEFEVATRRIAAGELIPSQQRGVLARLWPLWFTGMVVALATLAAIALD